MLRNIYLYGNLEEKYGHHHRLDVDNVGEAIRALETNRPGFLDTFKSNKCYIIMRGSFDTSNCLSKTTLNINLGKQDLHISPVLEGDAITLVAFLVYMLIVLVVCYVACLLLAPDPPADYDDSELNSKKSFLFSGPTNTMEQGGAIPLVYGRMIIGSTVVSAGVRIESM